jgi:antitoxin ParD1/3/4
MPTVTISLPDSLKEFIEREVHTKGYGNVSEYVRGLLRDAQKREADWRLEVLLLEGLGASGKDIPLSQQFWAELKTEAAQMLARKQPPKKKPPTR